MKFPLLASELEVPLPTNYQPAQRDAYEQLRFYEMNVNNPVILAKSGGGSGAKTGTVIRSRGLLT